ncbi:sulfotransferase 1B1-like [Glandiceps talaboti]
MVDAETTANVGFSINVDNVRNFEVRPDDVFLLTYAKSGTTWMKEILCLLLNGGDVDVIKEVNPDARAPYLEMSVNSGDPYWDEVHEVMDMPSGFDINKLKSPRIIMSHLRMPLLPKQLEEKKPKIVYVARNPKDIAVSAYEFCQKELRAANKTPYENFSSCLQDFINVKNGIQLVLYDGTRWRDHVIPWWKKHEEENILFITYEDMRKDLVGSIHIISKFLDVDLSDDVMEKIANYCCFENMKKNKMALKSAYCEGYLKIDPKDSPFVRKGKVGGWKNYFTVADSEHFDKLYEEWIQDSGLKLTFEL